jgi:hypothetical protein
MERRAKMMVPESVLHWCGLAFLVQVCLLGAGCVYIFVDARLERWRNQRLLDKRLNAATSLEREIHLTRRDRG